MGSIKDCLTKYEYQQDVYPKQGFERLDRVSDQAKLTDECPLVIHAPIGTKYSANQRVIPEKSLFGSVNADDRFSKIVQELRNRNFIINGKVDFKNLEFLAKFAIRFNLKPDKMIIIDDDFYRESPELVNIHQGLDFTHLSFNNYSVVTPYQSADGLDHEYSNELFKRLLPLLNASQLAKWLKENTQAKSVSLFPDEDGFTKTELLRIVVELVDLGDVLKLAKVNTWKRQRERYLDRTSGDKTSSIYDHGKGEIIISDFALRDSTNLVGEIFHEFGHGVAKKLAKKYQNFVKISWHKNKIKEGAQFITPYARENPQEDFAESFAYYIFNPSKLKKDCPQKYDFLKNEIFNGVEFYDHVPNRFKFTESIYETVDQDGPVFVNPNDALTMSSKVHQVEDNTTVTMMSFTFSGAKDNQKLKEALITFLINGRIKEAHGRFENGKFLFLANEKGFIERINFLKIEVIDTAGNKSVHFFPNEADVEVDKKGKVTFSGNMDSTSRANQITPTKLPITQLYISPDQITLTPRPDIQIPGIVYEVKLAGSLGLKIDRPIRLSWSIDENHDPIYHDFNQVYQQLQQPTLLRDDEGNIILLVHFPPNTPTGEYELNWIESQYSREKTVDRYFVTSNNKIIIEELKTQPDKVIQADDITIANEANSGPDQEIEFDVVLPYQQDIESVEVEVKYNGNIATFISSVERKNGKLVVRIKLPSVSAEVEVRRITIIRDIYQNIDIGGDPTGVIPAKASLFESGRTEINIFHRIIIRSPSLPTE